MDGKLFWMNGWMDMDGQLLLPLSKMIGAF
jgi:hypothetical protein